MSRSAARALAGGDRTSLYQEITDKIITELEGGRVPWVQPWGTATAKAPLDMPKNAATQRRYSGINVLILWGGGGKGCCDRGTASAVVVIKSSRAAQRLRQPSRKLLTRWRVE